MQDWAKLRDEESVSEVNRRPFVKSAMILA